MAKAKASVEEEHTEPPILLNYAKLWTFYGLHKSTISKLVMVGNFTNIVKVGSSNYFKRDDVEKWIEEQTIHIK